MAVAVDTHALVWYLSASDKLGKEATLVLKQCELGDEELIISVVVLLEVLRLIEKRKISVSWEEFITTIYQFSNIVIYPLGFDVVQEMATLGSDLELHDRAIVATARIHYAKLITHDEDIQKSKLIDVIW